jgi:TRAP-type C4-dicarboxylate transport system permease small subunit
MPAAPSAFASLVGSTNRACAALGRVVDGFAIVMLAISAGLTFAAVIMRYGFGYSDQLIEDIARYTIVYACLVYVGPLQARNQHIAVDLISNCMSPIVKRVWQLLLGVLFLVVVAFVFAAGWVWVADLYAFQLTVFGGTMPAWIPSLAVPLGMGLAVLFGVAEVLRLGLAVASPPPDARAAGESPAPAVDASNN